MAIYLICLVFGTVFILGGAMFGHIFGGHDGHGVGSHGHAQAGADSSDGPGIPVFSPIMIAAFLAAFGGLGVIFTKIPATSRPLISVPLSLVGALILGTGLLGVLNAILRRSQSSSESKVSSLVGQSASVVSPISENGYGEIAYVQSGTRYTAPARSESGKAIPAGGTVKITKVVGTQFFVELV